MEIWNDGVHERHETDDYDHKGNAPDDWNVVLDKIPDNRRTKEEPNRGATHYA